MVASKRVVGRKPATIAVYRSPLSPFALQVALSYKKWPPEESFPMDRDADRWHCKNFTKSNELMGALSYFIRSGWPIDALDDFVSGIEPVGGWLCQDEMQSIRRNFREYSTAVRDLLTGQWEPGP